MILKKLENCPHCAGRLDDFGRCEFCGSKVYDLCDIDFRARGSHGLTYIRIRTDKQIILAPVLIGTINIEYSYDTVPTMTVDYKICGDVVSQQIDEE